MTLTSWTFAVFVLIVLAGYYLFQRRAQNTWLLVASYVFYATWSSTFAVILAAMTLLNYLAAQRLGAESRGRRLWLWAGIAVNLLALGFFKYSDFFIPPNSPLSAIQIVMPVGMSFTVLQAISYLLDVYRGQMAPSTEPVSFALYMAYFPKLISGPIERARSFLPQLDTPRTVDNYQIARSFTLIIIGLVRKIVIANTLADFMIPKALIFPQLYGLAETIKTLLAYAFYIYNDFAGYTDIARGVSGLLGIELMANFHQPYLARSMTEFWNSWHASLSLWLRDYIYFPLSRALLRRNNNARSVANIVLPPMATMLVSGLWHGVVLNLLVWGVLHGLYQVVERAWALGRPVIPADKWPRWRQAAASALVFLAVVVAWIPFRSSLDMVAQFITRLLTVRYVGDLHWPTLLLILISLLLDWTQKHSHDDVVALRWPQPARVALLAVAIVAIGLAALGLPKPFVYEGF